METKKCIVCSNMVPQTPGKKEKKYCSPGCRQKDWQNKRRQEIAAFRGKTGAVLLENYVDRKNKAIAAPNSEKPSDTKEKKQEVVKEAANDPPTIFPSEKSFRVYIEMINTGNWDRTVIEKDIRDNKRLTGPQKSMLYAKLNH